jgi:hypothetical protein
MRRCPAEGVCQSGMLCTTSRESGWRRGRLTVVDATNVQPESRKPLVNLARRVTDRARPADVIGDVHGCADELEELLGVLGYEAVEQREGGPVYAHASGSHGTWSSTVPPTPCRETTI